MTGWSRRATSIAVPLSLTLLAEMAAGGQTPTFRARVSLVRIDVLAVDHNRPIAGLTAADFEVLDNGVPQRVESTFAEGQPLDVLFAFDRSSSVEGETVRRLTEASHAVIDGLGPDDRAGLLTFDNSFRLRTPLTTDRARLRTAIDSLQPAGATSLFDALYSALSIVENRDRRTLILLFTDGWDNLSWLSEQEALRTARGSESVVYAVAYKASHTEGPDEDLLQDLTGATGGRMLLADSSDRLKATFLSVLDEMRARYVLTFEAAGSPGWHTLSVRLKGKRGRVVARSGYFLQKAE